MPFLVSWPGHIAAGNSAALLCQIDLTRSFAALLHQAIPTGEAADSEDQLGTLLGKNKQGRLVLVQQAGTLAIVKNNWKYIRPSDGKSFEALTGIETGNAPQAQLYHLTKDIGEKKNLATVYPDKVKELAALLQAIEDNRSGKQ